MTGGPDAGAGHGAVGRRADVVIVGAGVIGLASAWRLAQRGASVTVVDPDPGSGASGVAAGMIAPVTESRVGEDDQLRLNLASWSRWPDFAAELEAVSGRSVGFRTDGALMVGADADDRAVLEELAARHRAMGLSVEMLRGRDARALEPALAPGVRAGMLAGDERSVDPVAVVEALLVAVEDAGVRLVRRPASRIVGGHAVELDGGDVVAAGTVVLAAGSRSGSLAGLPDDVRPPVRPVKGEVVTLRVPAEEPLITRTVRGIVRGASVYLVPRLDGRVLVGATTHERGWDTTPTAGGTYELLRDALALVPALDDAEMVGVRAGLRPATPDDLPMIGPTALEGVVAATGHYRNGIMLTPVTADAVAAIVTDAAPPAEVRPCSPVRFGAGRASVSASVSVAPGAPGPSGSVAPAASAAGPGSGSGSGRAG